MSKQFVKTKTTFTQFVHFCAFKEIGLKPFSFKLRKEKKKQEMKKVEALKENFFIQLIR